MATDKYEPDAFLEDWKERIAAMTREEMAALGERFAPGRLNLRHLGPVTHIVFVNPELRRLWQARWEVAS
jgi:hypothetical protein